MEWRMKPTIPWARGALGEGIGPTVWERLARLHLLHQVGRGMGGRSLRWRHGRMLSPGKSRVMDNCY